MLKIRNNLRNKCFFIFTCVGFFFAFNNVVSAKYFSGNVNSSFYTSNNFVEDENGNEIEKKVKNSKIDLDFDLNIEVKKVLNNGESFGIGAHISKNYDENIDRENVIRFRSFLKKSYGEFVMGSKIESLALRTSKNYLKNAFETLEVVPIGGVISDEYSANGLEDSYKGDGLSYLDEGVYYLTPSFLGLKFGYSRSNSDISSDIKREELGGEFKNEWRNVKIDLGYSLSQVGKEINSNARDSVVSRFNVFNTKFNYKNFVTSYTKVSYRDSLASTFLGRVGSERLGIGFEGLFFKATAICMNDIDNQYTTILDESNNNECAASLSYELAKGVNVGFVYKKNEIYESIELADDEANVINNSEFKLGMSVSF